MTLSGFSIVVRASFLLSRDYNDMRKVIVILLSLHLAFVSFGQTVSYKNGKLWSDGVSLDYGSIRQQFGDDVLEIYKPARSEYVKGIVLTEVGSGVLVGSLLMQYALYRSSPYVFDVMSGKRPYEDWMNSHAAGGMGVLAGIAASGIIVGGLGVYHLVHGGNRMRGIAKTLSPNIAFEMSVLPCGISLSVCF